MFKKFIFLIFLSTLLFSKEITLGIVPQQSPLELSKKWLKITEYLNEKTGINVIFKTEQSIPLFEEKLYSGSYDIAYINPYHFILANNKQGYNAFIRSKDNIVGIILGRKNESFEPNNLKGKTFLFPAPNAFAATLLTKFELKKKFNFDVDKEAKVLYVNSHDSVYKGISRKVGDFGGGISRTFENFDELSDKENLEIVYITNNYPSHPFVYHPKLDKETVNKISKAFLEMPNELKDLLSIKEFITTLNSEFDVIRDLDVKQE